MTCAGRAMTSTLPICQRIDGGSIVDVLRWSFTIG
jgi:hypothetical protein